MNTVTLLTRSVYRFSKYEQGSLIGFSEIVRFSVNHREAMIAYSFICARLCPSKYRAILSWYFRMVILSWWSWAKKQDENETGLSFTLRSAMRKVRLRLLCLGANRFFEGLFTGRKQHRMDGWTKTNTSEYLWFCDRWLQAHEILLKGFSFPIWCHLYVRAVANECKKLVPLFFIDF